MQAPSGGVNAMSVQAGVRGEGGQLHVAVAQSNKMSITYRLLFIRADSFIMIPSHSNI